MAGLYWELPLHLWGNQVLLETLLKNIVSLHIMLNWEKGQWPRIIRVPTCRSDMDSYTMEYTQWVYKQVVLWISRICNAHSQKAKCNSQSCNKHHKVIIVSFHHIAIRILHPSITLYYINYEIQAHIFEWSIGCIQIQSPEIIRWYMVHSIPGYATMV